MTRRRRAGGSLAHNSSGSIGVLIEDLRQRDELPQALNAQLDLGLTRQARLAGRLGDQQRPAAAVLDLERRRHVAGPPRQPPQHEEAPPMKRMARVADQDLPRTGTVSLT